MKIKPVTGNSITVNPPMKTISSQAGFAALSKACAFAEEIISKYGNQIDDYTSTGAFVFLKAFQENKQHRKSLRDDFLIALKLMISRQLIVLGKIPAVGEGRLLIESYDRRISEIMLRLKGQERLLWAQLIRADKLIKNEEQLTSFIHSSEIQRGTHSETLAFVGIAELIHQAENASAALEPARSFHVHDYDFSSEPVFVFNKQRTELTVSDDADVGLPAVSNIDIENAHYTSGDSLIYKTDNTEAKISENSVSETTYTAEKESSEQSVESENIISKTTQEQFTLENTLNAHTEQARYHDGDSLIFKSKNSESNVSGSTEHTENITNASTVNQGQTVVENVLDVHTEQARYKDGDSLIFKSEDSESNVSESTEYTENITNASTVNQGQTVVENVLDVHTENARYQDGDSLIFKSENSESNVSESTEYTENITSTSTASQEQTVVENVLDVHTENARYNDGDSLIFKSKNSESNVSESTEYTENITNISTVNQGQTVVENVLDVHTENARYQDGDSLIFKSEKSESNVSESTEYSENITNTSTANQEQTAVENVLDVHTENARYHDGDSLILKSENNEVNTFGLTENSVQSAAHETAAALPVNASDRPAAAPLSDESMQLSMNTFMSAGAQYFSKLFHKNSGRSFYLNSLFKETLSGLQKNSDHSMILRAAFMLNHPENAEEKNREIILNAAETVFRKQVDISQLPELIRTRLSDTERTTLLYSTAKELSRQSGITDSRSVLTFLYEDRLLRLINSHGSMPIHDVELSFYPSANELKLYYHHTSFQRMSEEIESILRFSADSAALQGRIGSGNAVLQSRIDRENAALQSRQNSENAALQNRIYAKNISTVLQNTQEIFDRQTPTKVLPDYIINNFSLVKAVNAPRFGSRRFGYSGYPLHNAAEMDTVVLRRERALRRAASAEKAGSAYRAADVLYRHNKMTGGIALISERYPQTGADTFLNAEGGSGGSNLSLRSAAETYGEDAAAYSGTAAALSLREQPRSIQAPSPANTAQKPSVPNTQELVNRFGNLIDGADYTGASMDVTAQSDNKAVAKGLRELSARLNKAESQALSNAEQLKTLQKKQIELENSSLKSRDIRQLSDDVINRLRKQLRLDRSRYTNQ